MSDLSLLDRVKAARRAVIEKDFSHLNSAQKKAVMTTEGPLLLLAGAGSGKTTVLINRIANVLKYGRGADSNDAGLSEEDLVFLEAYAKNPTEKDKKRAEQLAAVSPAYPSSVIAITFTNKAANEIKERLEKMLGPESGDIWASTFHSACVRILRRDIDRLGFGRNFTIYDRQDSERAMKDVVASLSLNEKHYPAKSVLDAIGRIKDAFLLPEEYQRECEQNGQLRNKAIAKCYLAYQRRLKEANALDFDDIIFFTVLLLRNNQDVLEYYQNKFRYVMVDEYQDTNNLQYMLVRLLAGKWKNICVVGDDDQSIYRFRGATIENILNFENQFKNVRVIRLEQNYRSTKRILGAANAVISNNCGRKGKELWTENLPGEKLTLYTATDGSDEAQYVAGKILKGFSEGAKWSDFAVLYRMNAQSNQLEYAFKRNGIPYRIVGGIRFFDRAEVKDMLAYLSVVYNPSDDLRLKRIINTPARGIGQKTVDTVEQIASDLNIPMFEVLKSAGDYPELRNSAPKLLKFKSMILDLKTESDKLSLDEWYDRVVEESGYLIPLLNKNDEDSKNRIENVAELKSSIALYINNADEPTLEGFLAETALYTDIDSYDEAEDYAVMMTIHSAKGLEFPTVFLVGAEEGLFPSLRAIGENDEMEEERRLCYVAMTRAKEKLFITRAKQRMLFGRTTGNTVSRFVREIPDEFLEKVSKEYEFGQSARETKPAAHKKPVHKPGVLKSASSLSAERPIDAEFKKGDMVEHKAFGSGMVISAQPMGGDILLEIAFDNTGTKRLMAKYAAQHMKKI